jgi:predicted transglutaminase-like cysteine proteinase
MQNRGGDCEDIALNKYNELIKNGISPNKLDFIKGKANNQLHIVLRYYDDKNNKYLILEHAYIMDYKEYTRVFFKETAQYSIEKLLILQNISNFVHFFIG